MICYDTQVFRRSSGMSYLCQVDLREVCMSSRKIHYLFVLPITHHIRDHFVLSTRSHLPAALLPTPRTQQRGASTACCGSSISSLRFRECSCLALRLHFGRLTFARYIIQILFEFARSPRLQMIKGPGKCESSSSSVCQV